MQFADYVVSFALQTLTRSLLMLRDQAGPVQGADGKALAQHAEQLLSLWQMLQWSVGKLEHDAARHDLQEIVTLCAVGSHPVVRGAGHVRASLESEGIDLEEFLATFPALPADPDSAEVRDRLSCLLQQESARWRDCPGLRQVTETALIDHGIVRAFDRAERGLGKLDAAADREGKPPSLKRLARAKRWTTHCVNHLELLRPALSEAGRTRRWHLTRLAAKLEDQWELEAFARAAVGNGLKPRLAARLGKVVRAERRRLEKQRRKLSVGAFAGGAAAFREEVSQAVAQLGLEAIILLPLDALGSADTRAES